MRAHADGALDGTMHVIPKILHFIWVGDETIRPDNCIDTWRAFHPDWEVRVWGNAELDGTEWVNRRHMAAMCGRELNGVADMMRWEILHAHGGIVIDADSICLRALDDHLLDCEAFACWENEIARPGLIAAGYFGSVPANPFVRRIIDDIAAMPSVVEDMAWVTVGPQRLTDSYRRYTYSALRIYPSHYFIPTHFTGLTYQGRDPVYAHQFWGSTRGVYDQLHASDVSAEATAAAGAAPVPAPVAATPVDTVSPLESRHAARWVHRVPVSSAIATLPPADVFAHMCAGKRVLHIGCAGDDGALYRQLAPACGVLDGYDPDLAALTRLAPDAAGRLVTEWDEIAGRYDVVIAPAMMAQVPDAAAFLARLEAIDAPCFFVAVPDVFQCRGERFDYSAERQTFVEVIHPDHLAWYTPHTFAQTIRRSRALSMEQLWFFDGASLLALLSKQDMQLAA